MSHQQLPQQETLFKFQCDLLVKEMEYIHKRIADFDDLSFKIKGWAITLWSGIVAFGVSEGLAIVVLASIPAMITFWIVDAYFKQYQRRSMMRMGVIESFLDSNGFFKYKGLRTAFESEDFHSEDVGNFPVHDPVGNRTRKIDQQFEQWYRSSTNLSKCFTVPNVLYFYLIPLLTAVVLAFFLNL